MRRVSVYADAAQLAAAAAGHVAALAAGAIAARGRVALALAGGETPRPVYERLAAPPHAGRIDWTRVEIFFGDERCVPPADERSNYAMVKRALLDRVAIPAAKVHRIHGEDEPQRAARDYEKVLARVLGADPLDLVVLGMGTNGHTASLFPGSALLAEKSRRVAAEYVAEAGMWRVTLTPLALNAAREAAFLVSGAAKAPMLARVLEGPRDPVALPAQIVQPAGELRWMVDAAAAAQLRETVRLSPG